MDGKEKRKKSLNAKKLPKPPRPHRGFSWDATDEKFINKLAELAMIKRARIDLGFKMNLKRGMKLACLGAEVGSEMGLFGR
nr:transmembrane protein [Tanacetum cinerariifolium]